MSNPKTTVIVDFSVCVHQLHNMLTAMEVEKDYLKAAVQAQMVWLHSGEWIKPLVGDNIQLVYVTDSKPYWRKDYLLQEDVYTGISDRAKEAYLKRYPKGKKQYKPEPVHYKAGRKFPEYEFTRTKKWMLEAAARNEFSVLSVHSYEADDLAAALVMTNRMLPQEQQNNIVLATVDTDWMGLIDDRTTWFCTYGYAPRVRYTMDHINGWAMRRLGTELSCPRDIWRVKTIQGDKSDNLPPGSPIEVIDLTEPPMEHRLWLRPEYAPMMRNLLTQEADNKELPLVDALNYIRKLGVNRFIKPYSALYEAA